jgi:hypothetical protein
MTNSTQREITSRLSLSLHQIETVDTFTKEEVDSIVHLTTRVNQNLEMGRAIKIQKAGFAIKYEINPEIRHLVDIWCEYPDH